MSSTVALVVAEEPPAAAMVVAYARGGVQRLWYFKVSGRDSGDTFLSMVLDVG